MRIHHLALRTRSLATLEAFYAGVLGLGVLRRDGTRSVWLDAGGAIVMLERAEAGEPEPPRGSMELVAFAIEEEERAARRAALGAAGVGIEAETAFTLYVRDPDGRRVALSHYEPST